jgi:hypothetical protein
VDAKGNISNWNVRNSHLGEPVILLMIREVRHLKIENDA